MSDNEYNDRREGAEEPASVSPAVAPDTPLEEPLPDMPADATETAVSNASAELSEDAPGDSDSSPDAVIEPEPLQRYRWNYEEQQAHDRSCGQQNGQQTAAGTAGRRDMGRYVVIIALVFLLGFGILLATLLIGRGIQTSSGVVQNDPTSREEMQPVEQAKKSVVVIEVSTKTGGGTGTGIVLNANGYIATNHHVVADAIAIRVTFSDGTSADAELVGSSEMDDLAVIRVQAAEVAAQLVPAVFVEDSDDCYVGQTVYAIGTPAGAEFAFTTTRGIISYVNREVRQYNSDGTMAKKLRTIQTDAKVNPGNSGGPLVDTEGRVVGIVSMKLAGDYEGIGFAIPSDGALEILNAIIKYGNADSINSSLSFDRPLLGIRGIYVEKDHTYLSYVLSDGTQGVLDCEGSTVEQRRQEVIAANGQPGDIMRPSVSGVYVSEVTAGLGSEGKLQAGDIIVSVDGQRVTSMNELTDSLNGMYVGDTVTVKADRGGQLVTVEIQLQASR